MGGLRVVLERVVTTFNEFGVIPVFRDLDGKVVVLKEVPFSSAEEARRAAHIYAQVLGGAVACRHDPGADTVGQGVIIGKYGVMAAEKSAHPPVRSGPDNVTRLIDHMGPQTGVRLR